MMNNSRSISRSISICLGVFTSLAVFAGKAVAQESTGTPPAEDCDVVIKQLSDDLERFTIAAETIGRVRQRINDGEVAAQTPEEKKAAQEADLAILQDKTHDPVVLQVLIISLWDKSTKDLSCAKSRPQLVTLLDGLERSSERIGKEQEMFDRRTGKVDQASIDKDRDDVKRMKGEIKDLFAGCCAKKSPVELNTIGIGPIVRPTVGPNTMNMRVAPILETSVDFQFERAPKEPAKNLKGINGQVFYDFKKIGIGAEVAWTTGSDRISTTTDVKLHRFTGLFGPRFNVTHTTHNGDHSSIFHFNVLMGFDRDSTKFQSGTISTTAASTAFMISTGANLDVMFKKNFGIRPFDFAYQPTHFGGNWQSNWKLGAGIVFRFGKEKK